MAAFYSTYMTGKSSLCLKKCPILHSHKIYFISFQTYPYNNVPTVCNIFEFILWSFSTENSIFLYSIDI